MNILLAVSPILCLLFCLLALKLSAMKSGAISLLVAVIIFTVKYQGGVMGLSISIAKGFSLALFVILIIWGAMFLYNLVNEVGALNVIITNLQMVFTNKFIQFILLSWIFSAFLQGIAGFGVPVIVVTPILIALGFDPIVSVASVLVGHSWAISFGSMGSSIYAINMVTNAPLSEIVFFMSIFGACALLCTGITVCYIYGGAKQILKGMPYVLALCAFMALTLNVLARMEMFSVIGLLTGLVGLIACFIINKIKYSRQETKIKLYKTELNLIQAVLPYLLIVILSILFYILQPTLSISFDFPGYETALGAVVPSEEEYVTFNILKYPFSVIMMASLVSMLLFYKKGVLNADVGKSILHKTVKKCTPTSITIVFLLGTAVVMMDAGMINEIADFLVSTTKNMYPMVASFIGMLGAFVTGSNTNSNIMFGSLQEIAATSIGMSASIMCAVQSIGASVGCAISPSTVSLGATAAQVIGEESKIYRKTLVPVLLTILLLGAVNMILLHI